MLAILGVCYLSQYNIAINIHFPEDVHVSCFFTPKFLLSFSQLKMFRLFSFLTIEKRATMNVAEHISLRWHIESAVCGYDKKCYGWNWWIYFYIFFKKKVVVFFYFILFSRGVVLVCDLNTE